MKNVMYLLSFCDGTQCRPFQEGAHLKQSWWLTSELVACNAFTCWSFLAMMRIRVVYTLMAPEIVGLHLQAPETNQCYCSQWCEIQFMWACRHDTHPRGEHTRWLTIILGCGVTYSDSSSSWEPVEPFEEVWDSVNHDHLLCNGAPHRNRWTMPFIPPITADHQGLGSLSSKCTSLDICKSVNEARTRHSGGLSTENKLWTI